MKWGLEKGEDKDERRWGERGSGRQRKKKWYGRERK